jgi:hypothetical protein
VKTLSSQSLGSLKDYCVNWNAADTMEDTASSGNPKTPATSKNIASSGSEIPAKPRIIAKEFFKAQQHLFQIVGATTVSNFYSFLNHISPQSLKMPVVRDMGI